jgi:hypothetical protein
MSTWAALKQKVFLNLDLPINTTGDVEVAVENALQDTLEDLITDINPLGLLVKTSAQSIIAPATTVSLGSGGFDVLSVMGEIFAVTVNTNPTDANATDVKWDELSWERYVIGNASVGDSRPKRHWSKDPSDVLYFTTVPPTGSTYDIYLHYYKLITAYADAGTPEIPVQHHSAISAGATTMFPQLFSGARQELFQKHVAKFNSGIAKIQREQPSRRAFKRRKARQQFSNRTINWE